MVLTTHRLSAGSGVKEIAQWVNSALSSTKSCRSNLPQRWRVSQRSKNTKNTRSRPPSTSWHHIRRQKLLILRLLRTPSTSRTSSSNNHNRQTRPSSRPRPQKVSSPKALLKTIRLLTNPLPNRSQHRSTSLSLLTTRITRRSSPISGRSCKSS